MDFIGLDKCCNLEISIVDQEVNPIKPSFAFISETRQLSKNVSIVLTILADVTQEFYLRRRHRQNHGSPLRKVQSSTPKLDHKSRVPSATISPNPARTSSHLPPQLPKKKPDSGHEKPNFSKSVFRIASPARLCHCLPTRDGQRRSLDLKSSGARPARECTKTAKISAGRGRAPARPLDRGECLDGGQGAG